MTELKPHGADVVREWVEKTDGAWFTSEAIDRDLSLTPAEKDNRRHLLNRMVAEGKLRRHAEQQGKFRLVVHQSPSIKWSEADPAHYLPLVWPFGLQHLVKVFPRNLVVVAGESNTGKSTFCVDFVAKNMHLWDIQYLTSEMDAEEFREIFDKYTDIAPDEWRFEPKDRSHNYADAIKPDDINIIDYLEVTDNFWTVGAELTEIREALGKGIAIVCLQKAPGAEVGIGGQFSLHKPRLYLSMEQKREKEGGFYRRVPDVYEMRIVKAKHPMRKGLNPNGWKWEYKFTEGTSLFEILKMPFNYPTDVGIDDIPLPPDDPRVVGGTHVRAKPIEEEELEPA